MGRRLWWFGLLAAVAAVIGGGSGGEVTYDGRSLIIDGERKLLFSGSIHYPRSTPDMWPALISKAREGGLDAIDTYVFWNLHEPRQREYDFSGRRDIVRFIKEVQAQGLYVCLRIGPFIESEWSYGGLPFWLRDEVPQIVYRSHNEAFENGPPYVRWAAAMAVGLNTGVPWVMCKQDDAPDPVINACNGMKCGETFVGPNSPNKPAIWTENWTHFYDIYGNITKIRSAEDIAYHTALFIIKKKGSFINYYMYHGGTNFGRTAASFIITSYYDQAPLDEYGLIRQPKWGHLKELHAAVKLCSHTLLYGSQYNFSLGGELQEAYVYHQDSGECAAFLVNKDTSKEAAVQFLNVSYKLPPKSISILPDCKTVAFNTAKVSTKSSTRLTQPAVRFDSAEQWKESKEVIPVFDGLPIWSNTLLEQMVTTRDASDYLWYTASYSVPKNTTSMLSVTSRGHVLRAFVNGQLVGSAHGFFRNPGFTLRVIAPLTSGENNISLLSIMVGLPDSGAYMERRAAGLQSVSIQINEVVQNITDYSWGYQVGLVGERLQFYLGEDASSPKWVDFNPSPQPLTWYPLTNTLRQYIYF
ncbi:beta-galactosidase 16-like [Dorcoceras hygrometricum]|uniref:beta-galactosidase n=1 Tax=Dorcoceras hygrometricum TaxID=472368 RepID=A0A2Z7AV31_9LAMI|nr:beta-galactosidase 16-like [Dorcoceras hygrometricum]